MSPSNAKRRHRSLVDHEVQGRLLRKLALQWATLFIANTLGLMIWLRMFEQPDAGWGETFGDVTRQYLPFFVISTALIPAFLWDTLKTTNRFAGPIMRLRTALAEASRGQAVKPLRFRSNDFWRDIADDFNALVERCRNDAAAASGPRESSGTLQPVGALKPVSVLEPVGALEAVAAAQDGAR